MSGAASRRAPTGRTQPEPVKIPLRAGLATDGKMPTPPWLPGGEEQGYRNALTLHPTLALRAANGDCCPRVGSPSLRSKESR